jgi:hypothetical protein
MFAILVMFATLVTLATLTPSAFPSSAGFSYPRSHSPIPSEALPPPRGHGSDSRHDRRGEG